jgi:Holliday junction DNA helicase RuvB
MFETKPFTNGNVNKDHEDHSLAPRTWDTYIGQEVVKERLRVSIEGALSRYEPLKHVLILGQPGTGKTSLAEIIAAEMGADLLALTMTPNFKMQFLYKKIKEFEGGVIFLDEIHTLPKKSQHYLLDVLEKKKMTYDSGKVEYIDKPITFIGATTDPDQLIEPLYDRFPIRHTLQDYSDLEMAKIVERMALKLGLYPTKEACMALGRASAGVPRQARRLVFAAQDIGELSDVDEILSACGITPEGLTEDHLAYMKSLYELGGKAGIVNLANHSGRPRDIVERLEKLLVIKSYVEITPSGRVLSYDGMKALKEALS